jgi:hypothetical protein
VPSTFAPPSRSFPPGSDAYTDLLRQTRALRRESAQQREAWFALLPQDRKEELLFELEVLLKGLACFSNPRNHPGPPRRTPIVAQDFREPLALAREAMARVVILCRHLAPERDRAFVFARYLETVLPDDASRSRLVSETMTQLTPEESLFFLRNAMTNLHEVTIGISRLARVPFRLFYAVLGVGQREIAQSPFFNPLTALEFRPEFDRIQNPRILELMRTVPGDASRRLVALSFLSLFRMLRYLAVLESSVRDLHEGVRRNAGVIYVVMSVLRSDARALTSYLRHRAGPMLAEGYERDLLRTPAKDLGTRYDTLLSQGHQLLELKATLETIGANVRLEMRRAFEHDFPPPDPAPATEVLRTSVGALVRNLRPALQNAVLFLGKSLGARLEEQGVFDDDVARRLLSERLRRDVWMFARIVRAFADKAKATPSGEVRWQGVPPLQFVREFLAYFRAMGYPLLRTADYPRFDAFMSAMEALEESDLLDPIRLERAIAECEQFYAFLTELFDRIGRRDELAGTAFDRKAAARQLKLYLGAS